MMTTSRRELNGALVKELMDLGATAVDDLQTRLNDLNGREVSSGQRILLAARMSSVLFTATGAKNLTVNATAEVLKAGIKQLDAIEAARVRALERPVIAKATIENNVYRDSSLDLS